MPHVVVKLWSGKSEQQKRRLAARITEEVMEVLGYGSQSVSVPIEEVASLEWAGKVYRPGIVGAGDTLHKEPGYTM